MLRLSVPPGIVALFAAFVIPTPSSAADPLDCIPASAHVVVVAEKPRQLAEAVTELDAFQRAQSLAPVRQLYDSTTARRLLQLLAFAEKELGSKWPDLLDQIGGNGVALSLQFYVDPAPALLILSGKDAAQVEKAYALTFRVIEEELARQGVKEKSRNESIGGVEVTHLGNDLHAARIGTTVLVSNKSAALKSAIEATPLDGSRPKTHPARRDAAKVLPAGALAWIWINFAVVKDTKQAKDFFDGTRQDFLQTLVLGSTIDCLKRADFVAIGLYREPTGFRLRLRIPAGRDGLWEDLAIHVPPREPGTLPLLEPPGTIYTHSLYLDAGYMWKNRARLITGDTKRDLEKAEKEISKILPSSVKLGELLEMWGPHHRVVVAGHDVRPYRTEPGLKLPTFGYVATARDRQFPRSMDGVFRAAGLIGTLQFGVKMKEHEHEGVTIVTYRFTENRPIAEDPDGLRFNFEPCFAVVGDELVLASTLELGKKLVTELKKPRRGEPSSSLLRGKGFASSASAALAGFSEPLVTDAVLGSGIGLSEARKQVTELVDYVKTLGTARVELDMTAKEYRLDVVWDLGKK